MEDDEWNDRLSHKGDDHIVLIR